MQKDELNQYLPGKCNLGEAEIRRRYRIGYIGLFVAIVIILIIHFTRANSIWKLMIFFPVFYGVSGFVQARKKFCYVFGFSKVFSMSGKRNFTRIKDEENNKADRWRAIQIVTLISIISVFITAIYFLLPY